jgi:Ca2+-binding RTX toxin-like protein
VTHTYADGAASYTISATATDEDGTHSAGNTVAVMVNNVAPTANAGGPYATFDDTPIVLNGTATDPAGAADPLTFAWDLDGDNVFGETGAGALRGNEVGANPTYNPIGLPTSTQTVSLRVSDGDGGVTTVTANVDILGQGTVLIGGVLYVVGSNSANDIVIITKVGSDIKVLASFNSSNPMSFASSSITEIRVRTRGGHDIVVTTPNVTQLMTIDGGTGNDLLTGGGGRNVIQGGTGNDILYGSDGDDVLLGGTGNDDLFGASGNDVLVGGDGCDILNGGVGRDLLIGSQNEDLLNGGGDEDILIGGYTSHDNNITALDAIMAIWGSAASFNSRVATLTGSGGLLQAGVAVFDDDDCDMLVGGAGRDLVFGDTNPWDGAVDLITLQSAQDVLVAVN